MEIVFLIAGILVVMMAVAVAMLRSTRMRWRTQQNQASAAFKQGNWKAAEDFARQARALCLQRQFDPWPSLLSASEVLLGRALYQQGKLLEAREFLEAGLATLLKTEDDISVDVGFALSALGDCCLDQGDFKGARIHFEHAVGLDEKSRNEGLALFHLQRLGDTLLELQKPTEAIEVLEQAIQIERKVIFSAATESSATNMVSMSMPDLRFAEGKWEEAARMFKDKAEYWSQQITDFNNVDVGRYYQRLSACRAAMKNYAGAAEAATEAAATYRRLWHASHPRVAANLARLAVYLDQAGQPDSARERAQEALQIFESQQLNEHPLALRSKSLIDAENQKH